MLLIFIVGPGGSHLLGEGLASPEEYSLPLGLCPPPAPSSQHLGRDPEAVAVDSRVGAEEWKNPCAQGWVPAPTSRHRSRRCLRLAGRDSVSWFPGNAGGPEAGTRRLARRADSPPLAMLVPGSEGRPALPSGPAGLSMPR